MPAEPLTDRSATSQPVRGADRNQDLVEQADPTSETTLFPTLEEGVTLLDIGDTRGVPILQSVVIDHLLLNDGTAYWVDANGHATTTTLVRIVPSRRLLNQIHVARGFTADQHYAAIEDLSDAIAQQNRPSTGEDTPTTKSHDQFQSVGKPSLIVVPAIDA